MQNYRGIVNLGGIVLVVLMGKAAIENAFKYGLRLGLPQDPLSSWPSTWPSLTCFLCLPLFFVAAFAIEALATRRALGSKVAALAHACLIAAEFHVPIAVIHARSNFVAGVVLMIVTLVMFLKLISFAHVSHEARFLKSNAKELELIDAEVRECTAAAASADATAATAANAAAAATAAAATAAAATFDGGNSVAAATSAFAATAAAAHGKGGASSAAEKRACDCNSETLSKYAPTLAHTFYFMAAPTLCFQLEYPRSSHIRWRFVGRRVAELLFCFGLQVLLVEQYILPAVANTFIHIQTFNALHLFERVLTLAVPCLMVWLLGFYALFHAFLNLVAELLRFGDRYVCAVRSASWLSIFSLTLRAFFSLAAVCSTRIGGIVQLWKSFGDFGINRCIIGVCATCTRRCCAPAHRPCWPCFVSLPFRRCCTRS